MSAAGTEPGGRRFEGVTAVVTGAGSGIGRATAMRLGAEGAAVACLDVVDDNLEATVAALAGLGVEAVGRHCDVSDEADVGAAVTEVAAALGRPGVLCNVAGIGTFAHTADMPLATWERILAVNLTGTFLMARAVLPAMLEAGAGSIVNVASTSGLMGAAYSAAYCASKGGVVLFTKALATEYAGRGVRVNAVAPGGVDTPLLANFGLPEGGDPKHIHRITSRMGFSTPEQVAAAIAFLASEESAYTTGAVLAVDGGITA
ncbi:MAG TPA: SDR family NAD(P)-dependent oxidoreductase [Acidimicrobiales bacterium]|nr:SDR family NAD(P)-dependent oxidoreductase [Acidimicrobiales bacterium]